MAVETIQRFAQPKLMSLDRYRDPLRLASWCDVRPRRGGGAGFPSGSGEKRRRQAKPGRRGHWETRGRPTTLVGT